MANTCVSALFIAAILGGPMATPAIAQKGPANTGPGSLAAARKYLEGRWSLMSFQVRPPGKPPLDVRGAGTLVFDGFGNLNVEIRVDEETARALAATGVPSENGRLSTSGRTVVDMQARTLVYVLEGQPAFGAPSGPLALNRARHWEVDGNVLTLTTRGNDGQPLSVARWEKAR